MFYDRTNLKGYKSGDTIPYTNRDSLVIYVRNVTNGSPAYSAGLKRGDIIANLELNYNTNAGAIVNAMDASSLQLVLYKPKTKTKDTLTTMTKAVYTFNPVLRDTMITVGSKKIAYIAYQSFTSGTNSKPAFDAAFSKFSDATDIVVDLRYNGGGYVSTAEYLINLLVPQTAQGKVAFAEYYNQTMQNGQATLLKNQIIYNSNNQPTSNTYFDVNYSVSANTTNIIKTSGINTSSTIKSIYFIVSSNTASASELVINSVKPYFDNVVLIGGVFSDNGKLTYGKPIGFFELRLGKYSIYMSNFESKNAAGDGGYYNGISTNYQIFDDVRFNYGDPNESCFLQAIRLITGNSSYSPTSTIPRSLVAGATNIMGIGIGQPTNIHDMIVIPGIKH